MKNIDYEIIEILEKQIRITTGEEQKEWVRKQDIFTLRNLFIENNNTEKLKEVDKIRKEILKLLR